MDADLSRWHHVRAFSARDAVCLALGIDPADPAGETWKAEPILQLMRWDYGLSVAVTLHVLVQVVHNTALPPHQRRRPALDGLVGDRLGKLWMSPVAPEEPSVNDLISRLRENFDTEVFRRRELRDYFTSIGIVSVYDFDARAPEAPSVQEDWQLDLGLDKAATYLTQDEFQVEAFVDTGLVPAEVLGAPRQSPTGHPDLSRGPSKPAAVGIESRPRFKQKMPFQEDRIIEIICSLGFDPKSLPPASRRYSVKKQVQKLAIDGSLFTTTSVFKATWQRLRDDGRIGGGRTRRAGDW
jgi:hypothetical protein